MRVCFYFFHLAESSGGAERMLISLANEMAQRGHAVAIVSWDDPGATSAFYPLDERVRWHRLGFSPGAKDKLRRMFRLWRLLRRMRPDVFVGFVMSGDKTVYAANLLARVPIVAAERNAPEMYAYRYSPWARRLYLRLLGLCRRVVVQLDAYRTGYPNRLQGRLRVIENPVRPAHHLAQPHQPSTDGFVLLAVGRLDPQKNLDALIRAFAVIADRFPRWRLRIVGDGEDGAMLRRLSASLNLAERIDFVGVTREIEAEYARAHLFAFPSRWEGFPNALAEALAHGLPAVGFARCPGVNVLIEHGVNGLLAEGLEDPASLARVLAEAMSDHPRRRVMGEAAATAMARFAPERIWERWERVLAEAAMPPRAVGYEGANGKGRAGVG